MSAARFAFGHARVRARKSRLLVRDDALLRLVRRDVTTAAGEEVYPALGDDYSMALRSYPEAGPLVVALWRRHEVENLKLAWRARGLSLPDDRWRRLWRPLGSLARLALEDVISAASLAAFVARLRATPYGDVAAAVWRAHAADPTAAELALERWTYACIVQEASALAARDAAAAALALRVVRERDFDRLRRAVPAYGLSPALAGRLTALLALELRPDVTEALAAWTPGGGPLGGRLPRRMLPDPAGITDWDALILALRRERRRACARVFAGPPFTIAQAIAYLLLREAEIEGRLALAVPRADPAVLERVLSAGQLGA